MCTALVVGNMVGTGIFLLPVSLAPLGWNALFGWALTIVGGLCLAYVFASLARTFPKAGGPYAYSREAFGPVPAFMVAWSYWISLWVGNAAIATGAVSYLSVFFPQLAKTTGLHAVVTCSAIWLFVYFNCRGTVVAGGIQLVTTILKIMPLIFVILIGAYVLTTNGMTVLVPFESSNIKLTSITAAATLTLWSLLGLESATVPAGNVDHPQTTIPRATLIGTGVAGLIYLLVFASILLLMPTETLANSTAPFADFTQRYLNNSMGAVMAAFASISGFGALNGWILLQGELPNAMAKNGVFPRWLAVRSKQDTPVRALMVSSVLLTLVVILLATAASLFMFLACSLAALKLQLTGQLNASPIIWVVGLLAVCFSAWTIYGAGQEAVLWGLVLLFAGLPVYLMTRHEAQS